MKYIAIILLVAVGVYLYKRAQRLAQEEKQATQKPVEKVVSGEAVDVPSQEAEKVVSTPADEGVTFEHVEPAEPVEKAEAVEAVEEPVEVVAAAEETKPVEVVEAEKAPEQAAAEPEPAFKMLAVTDESWANDKLTASLAQYRAEPEAEGKHVALLQAIAECYKQRKQEDYREYGAALSPYYQSLFAALPEPTKEKGVGFMQLATLLNDCGDFDGAIKTCQAAIGYGLSDGTVTGFEGRITRIEKAKAKAQS